MSTTSWTVHSMRPGAHPVAFTVISPVPRTVTGLGPLFVVKWWDSETRENLEFSILFYQFLPTINIFINLIYVPGPMLGTKDTDQGEDSRQGMCGEWGWLFLQGQSPWFQMV